MSADDSFNKALRYFLGEETGRQNITKTIEYLTLAKNAGHKKAAYIISHILSQNNLFPYYIYLEATKIGNQRAYQELVQLKNIGYLHKYIPAKDLNEFNQAITNFIPVSPTAGMSIDDIYIKGLRYFVGEETGRQNITKGREWLMLAMQAGHKGAAAIFSSKYPAYYAYMAAAEIGIVRAAKKFTQWHLNGDLNGKISDAELIEFAKKIVALGDIY